MKTERSTLIQHDGGSRFGSSVEIRKYIDANAVTILFCNQGFGKGALFKTTLKGDYRPFENVLHNKEKRLERARQLIDRKIQEHKKRAGEIQKSIPIATLPSSFGGKNVVVTYVQLKGEKGSLFFR